MDSDTSWCPVCNRQIQPKRIQVPVYSNDTGPPLSSPQSTRRQKQRPSGLLVGTGHVKQVPASKRIPVKMKTVIDQGPTPLYCSDKCQMADINSLHGNIPHDYNPDRQSAPFAQHPLLAKPSASSVSSSNTTSTTASNVTTKPESDTIMARSLATLATIYNFPPLPPPAPIADSAATKVDEPSPFDYSSGIMMAARRIAEMCPKPQRRNTNGHIISEPPKPVPGWTDGSNAWRSTIYSLTSPRQSSEETKSYRSFVVRSHRSKVVQSTFKSSTATPRCLSSSCPNDTEELIAKFSEIFSRRSESRVSCYGSPPSRFSVHRLVSPPTPSTVRDRPLVQPGAEGKLLVPDVKMKIRSGSSSSLSSAWSGPSSCRRSSVRIPLSLDNPSNSSSDEDCQAQRSESTSSLPYTIKRPSVETRSWSYDNVDVKTYPVMRLPPRKEICREKRTVDGVETEVEVEVLVEEPLKRLFLFPASTRT